MKALICGISGQDGAYLAKYLLDRGYEVVGTSRDAPMKSFKNLKLLGIHDRVKKDSMALNDFRSVLQVITRHTPDEIYNLAGQTSVGLSFEQPMETMESIVMGTLNLLESIRFSGLPVKLYNAGSSECFGDLEGEAAQEDTAFRPRSPYAVAKSAAYWAVSNYREAYRLYLCTGILFNHESPLRPARFVTKKIVSTACRIAAGSDEMLRLGNIDIRRDWGWAPEYVEAMAMMLQQDKPKDFIIATGNTHSLKDFVAEVFHLLSLNWQNHVIVDEDYFRPTDLMDSRANPTRAAEELGWIAKTHMKGVVKLLIESEIQRQSTKS